MDDLCPRHRHVGLRRVRVGAVDGASEDMSDVNPFTNVSDDELVATHSQHPADNHYLSEMLLRHKVESAVLGRRVWWLNVLLLIFTVAICALTGVLVWTAFREMHEDRQSTLSGPRSGVGVAWVLWVWEPTDNRGNGVDEPVAAYANQRECLANLATGRSHRAAFVTSLARCLPNTVDPRGPKGVNR